MFGDCAYAASVARNCAKTKSYEQNKLGSLMCWTAVAHCALLAGVINESQYKKLKGGDAQTMVTKKDKRIKNKAELSQIPEGHIIFFFHDDRPIHAMLSTGKGKAAGNKNDCIGVGSQVGWEELDLGAGMLWSIDGHLMAPLGESSKTGKMLRRVIQAYHRPITDLKT